MVEISCHIQFHTHGTKEDVALLKEQFSKCDLYVPEIANPRPRFRRQIYRLANGDIPFSDFMGNNIAPIHWTPDRYWYNFYKMIADSQKTLFIMERPWQGVSMNSVQVKGREARSLYQEGRTNLAIEVYKEFLLTFASNTKLRDDYLVTNFARRLRDKIRRTPSLSKKKLVRVFMSIGMQHELIFERIATQLPTNCTKEVVEGSAEGVTNLFWEISQRMVYQDYIPTDNDILQLLSR